MKRAWSQGMFYGSKTDSSIFSRFLKFFRLGLSKREFSYRKTYFSYLTNNRKCTGKQNNIFIDLVGQLPGRALCLMSNLSDYVYPIIPAADCKLKVFHRKAATLSSRLWTQQLTYTKEKVCLISTISRWKKKRQNMRPEFRPRMSNMLGTFSVTFKG